MEGGTWAQQEGAGVVSGAQGSCIAGGRETEPSGESLGLVTQPPGPSGSESSTICPGRTGSQALHVAWALRARMGGGQGSPWRKRLCGQRSISGSGRGVTVAEAGAREVEEAATPKMLQAPGHCHLTQAGLFSRTPPRFTAQPPPRLPGHEHPAPQPPSPAGPCSTNPADT